MPGTRNKSTPPGISRGRRIAFRVWSVLVSLLVLVGAGIGALELGLMWLPDQTLISMFDDPGLPMHRAHFMIVGIIAWAYLLATLVQLRKPERRVAPMLQLVVMALGGSIAFFFSGTVDEWLLKEGVVLVPVMVLALLHPRASDLIGRPGFDRNMMALAGLASIPWVAYIVENSRLQLINVSGDSHAQMEHWAIAALLGITMIACAVIGSSQHPGWRLPAWIAAGGSVVFGVHSLVYPGLASGLSVFWAVAAIVWGLVFVTATEQRARSRPGKPVPADEAGALST
jgi:hypothetical protein